MKNTHATLQAGFLEDIELGASAAGIEVPPTGPGTHFGLTALGAGNLGSLVLTNVDLADADVDPTRAEDDALDELREGDGLPVVPPTSGAGLLSVLAYGKVTVPAGLRFQCPGGAIGITTASAANVTRLQMELTIPFSLLTPGETGLKVDAQVVFLGGPLNLATSGHITEIEDGQDLESNEHKRGRIMNRRQFPVQGGNWSQLRETALNVPGVDDAYVYPALGGTASVRVVLLQNGTPPNNWKRAVEVTVLEAAKAKFAEEYPTNATRFSIVSVGEHFTDVIIRIELNPGVEPALEAYETAFREACSKLGPGENVADPVRLRRCRCFRHPIEGASVGNVVLGQPMGISQRQLSQLQAQFPEIVNISYDTLSAPGPPIPGSLRVPPNVLRPRTVTFTIEGQPS